MLSALLQGIGLLFDLLGAILMANVFLVMDKDRKISRALLSAFVRGKYAEGIVNLIAYSEKNSKNRDINLQKKKLLMTFQGLSFIAAGFMFQLLSFVTSKI